MQTKREEIKNITEEVKSMIKGKKGNACFVYTPHATCSVIINENYDEAVCEDILIFLKSQIPQGKWLHDKTDDNADSHIKAAIIGPGQLIPLEAGKLQLGTWQGIGLAEFDGPRERKVIIKLI